MRPPTQPNQMFYGLSVFVALFFVLFALPRLVLWVVGAVMEPAGHRVSLDLPDDDKLSGTRASKSFSPDGGVFFEAKNATVRGWTIDESAVHHWTRKVGTGQASLATRDVISNSGPALELAVLSSKDRTVRLYRFKTWGLDVRMLREERTFQAEFRIEGADALGTPDRIEYRPRRMEEDGEILVFFEKGWVRRYRVNREGEAVLVRWYEPAAARSRGMIPADQIQIHSGKIDDVSFSRRGEHLVTVHRDRDRFVRVLRFEDDLLTRTPEPEGDPEIRYYSVAIRADGRTVAAARGDGPIDLFDLVDGQWRRTRGLPARGKMKVDGGLAFRAGGGEDLVAIGHDDVWIWDCSSGVLRRTLDASEQILAWRLAENRGGSRFYAVDEHGQVRNWILD